MASRYTVLMIPVGTEGLTGQQNLSRARPGQLLRAQNITYENGTVEKISGTTRYTATTLGTGVRIMAGHDWWPSTGVQRAIVVTSAGAVRMDGLAASGGFGTSLCTLGSVTSVVPVFVEGGAEASAAARKLFLFSGSNPVKRLSATGSIMTTIASGPADWSGTNQPTTGVIHAGRLWGFKDHRGYYSSTVSHETFATGGGSIAVYPGEGEGIAAACVYGSIIIVWKRPAGIYAIDTTDPAVTGWTVRRLSRQLGIAGPRAYLTLDGSVAFVDPSGELYDIGTLTEAIDVRPQSLTEATLLSPWLREHTNPAQYGKIQAIYYPAKRRGEIAMAGSQDTTNTIRLILDFNGPLRYAWTDQLTAESLWLRKDSSGVPRPTAGDATGNVWRLDQETRSHDGDGYLATFQTPHLDAAQLTGDLAVAGRRMNGAFLECVVDPQGDWTLDVDVLWDGALKIYGLTFDMGQTGAALGNFILDQDVLGGEQVLNRKRRIAGGGRRISLIARNSGAAQNFSLSHFLLHVQMGDERNVT